MPPACLGRGSVPSELGAVKPATTDIEVAGDCVDYDNIVVLMHSIRPWHFRLLPLFRLRRVRIQQQRSHLHPLVVYVVPSTQSAPAPKPGTRPFSSSSTLKAKGINR